MQRIRFREAVLRGLKRHCPHCNSPTLFNGYLTVRETCPRCKDQTGRHRVDDIAAYFTILLVGHAVLAPALALPFFWNAPLWASMTVLLLGITVVTLAALPYVKGGVVGALAAIDQPEIEGH